jgi:alkylated DNA repair dioxygenase AlkB
VSAVQPSLFVDGPGQIILGSIGAAVSRTDLAGGAWVDLRPGWLTGADGVFERLQHEVPWRADRRRMYDRMVDVPRLVAFYAEAGSQPDPTLELARHALGDHYRGELGEDFTSVGLCLYRDGRDSVAWHGDTLGRGATHDTVVAILSLGATRRFHLRPRGGGPALRFGLASGDLLVMGGACQRTWEHSVPKTAKPVGPRISVQFRPSGVG